MRVTIMHESAPGNQAHLRSSRHHPSIRKHPFEVKTIVQGTIPLYGFSIFQSQGDPSTNPNCKTDEMIEDTSGIKHGWHHFKTSHTQWQGNQATKALEPGKVDRAPASSGKKGAAQGEGTTCALTRHSLRAPPLTRKRSDVQAGRHLRDSQTPAPRHKGKQAKPESWDEVPTPSALRQQGQRST